MSTPSRYPRAKWPVALSTAALLACAIAFITANPLLTAACALVLLLVVGLLWRPGEPPVLVFAVAFQWLQVSTLVLFADFRGEIVAVLARRSSVETAIWLGLAGLTVLSLGIRFGVGRLTPPDGEEIDRELRSMKVDRIFAAYLMMAIFSITLPYYRWQVPALTQPLQALVNLKWVLYILLGYATLRLHTRGAYFLVATILEFVAGIGYFSGFKSVLFVAGLVLLGVRSRLSARALLSGAVVAGLVAAFGIAWTSVKEQYRDFLNQGTGQQVVLVSPTQQFEQFASLMSSVDLDDLRGAVNQTVERVSYVEYFAAVLDFVPSKRPFENGALLWKAIRHVLIPRFLDPAKPALESDSEETARYTGLTILASDPGTSISIGYMGEGYIDFGIIGMLLLVLSIGALLGYMYRWMLLHSRFAVVGTAFGTALLVNANQFEAAEIKLLGGMVSSFLVLAVVLRFGIPWIQRWWARTPRSVGGLPAAAAAQPGAVVG